MDDRDWQREVPYLDFFDRNFDKNPDEVLSMKLLKCKALKAASIGLEVIHFLALCVVPEHFAKKSLNIKMI